ncbi:MAG: replication initiator protein A [Isosphaeraceae bacterium]
MEDQERQAGTEDPREVLRPSGGRDELNLAEFPITLLSDRVPKGCKTLEFEIEPRDKLGQVVSRKLKVTGGDAYGLPTAIDDEILVALIQLTKFRNDFTEQTVSFTRYEIFKLLGWPDDGRSYQRVKDSINRWAGVTLYYDNAWWDKEKKAWISETFHIIDRASFVSKETRRSLRENQQELPLSSFKWSDVIFRSFQAGSLKRLDVDAYFSFSTSIAKRMYRFLDKRFWLKDSWEFDLKEFAFEHIGLSRKYNVAQIKNKLQPALDELSQSTKQRAAFIDSMKADDRYVKVGTGHWLIKFTRKSEAPLPLDIPLPEPSQPQGLIAELVSRGVSSDVAADLVRTSPAEHVSLRIEVFDWILQQKNQKLIRENPTGYLVSSIRDRYFTVPKGFEPRAEREKRQAAEETQRQEKVAQERKAAQERRFQRRLKDLWDSMTPEEQARFDAEALSQAEPERRAQYESTAPEVSRRLLMVGIREAHLRRTLVSQAHPEAANA